MVPKIIQQGAEAILLQNKNLILKKRIEKSYRINEIDEKIRKLRTRTESKLLIKASKLIPTPKIIEVKEKDKEIEMEFISGKKLSDYLNKFNLKEQINICKKIGKNIAKLHQEDIIHGDLTTSNMILKNPSKKKNPKEKLGCLYFIDYGLGYIGPKIEDKAVELHLLREALEAKHFENWEKLFKTILIEYKKNYQEADKVIERLKAVEKRGRYKH